MMAWFKAPACSLLGSSAGRAQQPGIAAVPLRQSCVLRRKAPPLQQRRTAPAPPQTAGEAAAPTAPREGATPGELVDFVLASIEGTDGGDAVAPPLRQAVDSALDALEAVGEAAPVRPLESSLIYGNYDVAYVSAGSRQYGAPAGGRFRSTLGKLIFATTGLFQSVLQPDVVTNKVEFRLLGCLPGAVGLRGRLQSIPWREGGEDRKDTVKVFFEPPVLSLPGGIHVRIGPPSTVVLKTTYLDEQVRLGKGSRGSLFAFTRGGSSDLAGMERVGQEQTSRLGLVVLGAILAWLAGSGAYMLTAPGLPVTVRAAGCMALLLAAAFAGVCWRGGIVDASVGDRPEVAAPAAAPAAA